MQVNGLGAPLTQRRKRGGGEMDSPLLDGCQQLQHVLICFLPCAAVGQPCLLLSTAWEGACSPEPRDVAPVCASAGIP